ncbi:MAG: iron chelate uptake ABC transporter family permease subunit [Actinomycetota bacterium]
MTTTIEPESADAGPPSAGSALLRVGQASRSRRLIGLIVLVALVVFAVLASLAFGTKSIPIIEVITAYVDRDPSDTNHLIVRDVRQPRTMLGIVVGAGLGGAGALMQGVTRNPLADPGLLGVNAGASFMVVLGIWLFNVTDTLDQVWFALVGAALASIAVYVLGTSGRAGATPVRLALAGAALGALLFAFTRTIILTDQQTLDEFRFWAVGSLAGRNPDLARQVAPFIVVGVIIAFGVARQLNALALGDDAARALGTRLGVTRAVSVVGIMLLCGAAVAAAGPIAFVGLVVPHAARAAFGPDQRWLIPTSVLLGVALVLLCDTAGRLVARPAEIQVGIMTAVLGGPVFILLVRRIRMAQL